MPPLNPFNKSCLALAISQIMAFPASQAATINVNDAGDSLAADMNCTLHEAIISANTNPGNTLSGCVSGDAGTDTITFETSLLPAIISPTYGPLIITEGLEINGPGNKAQLTINGASVGAISSTFRVENGATVSISGMTISGGSSLYYGAGVYARSSATVNLSDCTISGNTAKGGGGLAARGATINLNNCTVLGNSASKYGGGIKALDSSSISLTNSTVSDNTSGAVGGGISLRISSSVSLTNSSVSSNSATSSGGGISVAESTLDMDNSTVTNNSSAEFGGGIHVAGTTSNLGLSNSIVSGNIATTATELRAFNNSSISLNNANLLGESGQTIANAFYGVIPGATDIVASSDGNNPTALASIIGPLADNGGPTEAHLLVAGSPAIDAAELSNCPPTDQRGKQRDASGFFIPIPTANGKLSVITLGGGCDIGSVEFSPGD